MSRVGNFGEDLTAGLASGLAAEARQKGSGAGFAAAFAGSAMPTLERRRDRLDRAGERRQAAADAEDFVSIAADVPDEIRQSMEQLGVTGVVDDADQTILRGVRAGMPVRPAEVAAAIEEGDPLGLEGAEFGSVNGIPALAYTGPDGRRRVMTISSGQWLGGLRARETFRRRSAEMAEQRRERAATVDRVKRIVESRVRNTPVLASSGLGPLFSQMAEIDPEGTASMVAEIAVQAAQDEQKAAEMAEQAASQFRVQRSQTRALSFLDRAAAVAERRRQAIAANPSRGVSKYATRSQVARLNEYESAVTMLQSLVPQSAAEVAVGSPLVNDASATRYVVDAVLAGVPTGGERLDPVAPGTPEWGQFVLAVAQGAERLFRDLGYDTPPGMVANDPVHMQLLQGALSARLGGGSAFESHPTDRVDPAMAESDMLYASHRADVAEANREAAIESREMERAEEKHRSEMQSAAAERDAAELQKELDRLAAITDMLDSGGPYRSPFDGRTPELVAEARAILARIRARYGEAAPEVPEEEDRRR